MIICGSLDIHYNIIVVGTRFEMKNNMLFQYFYCYSVLQETACGIMTECTSPHMITTTIIWGATVQLHIMERGGITHVTGQTLTGNMGTLDMAKGSIGIPGMVSITP